MLIVLCFKMSLNGLQNQEDMMLQSFTQSVCLSVTLQSCFLLCLSVPPTLCVSLFEAAALSV